MGRPHRTDIPGEWHHLMNRGVARMTLFETPGDYDFFIDRVERVAKAGLLEVHVGVVMGNHFHFLARSTEEEMSEAMLRIQGPYAQRFNRLRSRPGHVFQRRFHSVPVRSYAHRCLLVPYIDWNPVCAGIAELPWRYEYGSARHYAGQRGGGWLTRSWVEAEVRERAGIKIYTPEAYRSTLGSRPSPGQQRLLDRRATADIREDDLDGLLIGSEEAVSEWLVRATTLHLPPAPITDAESIESIVARAAVPSNDHRFRRLPDPMLEGLLTSLGGLHSREVASRLLLHPSTIVRRVAEHRRRIREDEGYLRRAAHLAMMSIARCHLDAAA